MKKKADDQYLEKVKKLSKEQAERLHSRMRSKLTRRAEDEKITELEALAIQLELEDEQLAEWRKERSKLNEKLEKQKAKDEEKAKDGEKAKK
jgi:hypothetical protein